MTSPNTVSNIRNVTYPNMQNFTIRNSVSDANGDVLFYVGQDKIVDRFANLVCDFNLSPGANFYYCSELPIIPCIDNNTVTCLKKYYVFYVDIITAVIPSQRKTILYAKIITVNSNTGQITAQDVTEPSNPTQRLIIMETYLQGPGSTFSNTTAFAASKLINNNRFLYIVREPGIHKITLSDINSPNQGVSTPSLIFSRANDSRFEYGECWQANLSSQGDKLTWATAQSGTQLNYYVLGLNSITGDISASRNVYPLFTIYNTNESAILGVEFSENGRLLFASCSDGLFSLDLINGNGIFNNINGSSPSYGWSTQLELAPNGEVFARNNNSIASIEKNGTTFPSTTFMIASIPTYGQNTLPDQIDGENYSPYLVNDFYDESNYFFTASSSTVTYTPTSNPINTSGDPIRLAGLTRIAGGINPSSKVTYIFQNMAFEMSQNAIIEVMDNAEVRFLGCTFRSAFCAGLWNGIEVNGNGQLIADISTASTPKLTKITDAINGIKISGGQATFSLSYVWFDANSTSLKVVDYKPFPNQNGSDVLLCTFTQTVPLKVSPLSLPPIGTPLDPFGKIGIDISTTTTPNQTFLKVLACKFEGGRKGININKAPLIVNNLPNPGGTALASEFSNFTQGNAIYIDMGMQNYPVTVQNSSFNNIQNAIASVGRVDLKVLNNTITNTNQHGIYIDKNNDGIIEIGNNNFTSFYHSAILITNSATSSSITQGSANGTQVRIYNNAFDASLIMNANNNNLSQLDKPTAITLSEVGKGSSVVRTYTYLRVNNNTGNNIAYGIKAANIVGYQFVNDEYKKPIASSINAKISDIDMNTWNIYATYNAAGPISSDYNAGIVAANCNKLRIALNTINSNQFTQWRSPGVYLDNAGTNLIYGNAVQAGRGIGGRFMGLGNDLLCNSLKQNVNGISLQDFRLRTWAGSLHGQQNVAARDNAYTATRDYDIELYTWKYSGWQPSTLQSFINSNQWTMVFNPSVLIEPNPNSILGGSQSHIFYIKNGIAPDKCGYPLNDRGEDDPNDPDPLFNQPPQSDDAFEQWMLQYEYISEQQALTGVVGNTFIDRLLVLQQHISQGDISVAVNMLATMPQPSNVFEQNMLNVYQLWLTAQKENRNLNETEVASLVQIATPNTYEIGIASYVARAILWAQEGLNFVDMVDRKNAGIGVKINFAPCNESLPADFTIELKDENDNIYPATAIPVQLDEEGYAYIAPQYVSTLSPSLLYTFQLQGGEFASPPLQTLHSWMDNAQGNIISLCNFGKSGGAIVDKKPSDKTTQQPTENTISVYPNPAKETATVQLPMEGTFNVTIYDALGKQVYQQQHSSKQQLPIHQYEAGVYFVKINNAAGDTVYHNRLLIVK